LASFRRRSWANAVAHCRTSSPAGLSSTLPKPFIPRINARKSHPTRCKSRSEDATLLHLALSHFVPHPHPHPLVGPNRHASLVKQTSLRNAEVLASWRQFGGRGVLPRRTEPVEGRALRLGERRVCEAGYEGMIGRTLGEEEEIAATGNRSRFSDARQVLRSRPPLKKEAVAASAFVGVGRLPSNRRASSLSPQVDWTLIVVRVWFFFGFLCDDKVVSHYVYSHPIVPCTLEKVDCDRPSSSCTLHVIYRALVNLFNYQEKSFSPPPFPTYVEWNRLDSISIVSACILGPSTDHAWC
jgi:hypothetical protein